MQGLENRKKLLAQRKEKLKKQELKLNELLRKQRTQKLIELGGLVAKAGLDDLPKNLLYGAMLHVKNNLNLHRDEWETIGGKEFEKEKKIG